MTETEWLACADPHSMLDFLDGKASGRKLRLFAVGCCRHIWKQLTDKRSRRAVETAEAFADGGATRADLGVALRSARQAVHDAHKGWARARHPDYGPTYVARMAAAAAESTCAPRPIYSAIGAVQGCPPAAAGGRNREVGRRRVETTLAALLRDVVGNPVRRVRFPRAWRTETAVALARTIYEVRAYDWVPILADALQEAGCEDAGVLAHCRRAGPHVRGCWVVDWLLGKE